MVIGLALKPSLVGKGLGADYVSQGISFGLKHYQSEIDTIKLEVEVTNKSAIRVYEKAGFTKVNEAENEIEMIKKLEEGRR